MTVRLGLTMGDPAGIGPEIVLAAARDLAPRVAAGEFALVVVGTPRCFERNRPPPRHRAPRSPRATTRSPGRGCR